MRVSLAVWRAAWLAVPIMIIMPFGQIVHIDMMFVNKVKCIPRIIDPNPIVVARDSVM